MNTTMIALGLEVLLQSDAGNYTGKSLGLLTNQASVDRDLVHGRLLLQEKFGSDLTTLFSPQHGFYSEKQDNMIESDHGVDPMTGLPVYSLYGEVRKPSRTMFDSIDILLVDLVDVGTRVYTFLYTLAYCLEAAAEYGKRVVVLDRPNPIGGMQVEGNILEKEFSSFVGMYPIPMRHGMTLGELALFINSEHGIGADLEVIDMIGWRRRMYYSDTGLRWVFPSPNMPSDITAMVYPGQVLWEGTNISEGRGTTLPFELFGSPFIRHEEVLGVVDIADIPGCFLRPLLFQPTSGKWAGEVCTGFQIHVTDREAFRPYRTGLVLLQALKSLYPEEFLYKDPPYEYEYTKLPIDLILGSQVLRKKLERGSSVEELETGWEDDLRAFKKKRSKYLLYED